MIYRDSCRNYEELKNLYDNCDNERVATPEEILSLGKDFYRCYYDKDNNLIGCAYLEDEGGKTMFSGFARRKSFKLIVEIIQDVLKLNPEIDIYSRTTKLNARYALRRAGFEKLDNELYIRKAVC